MKLFCDPISASSRPVMLFIADHRLHVELVHVDLRTGGHLDPAYLAINPNGIVPFLVDGDFGLGESSAILKYLADMMGSPTYPTELKARARVNEALDWFNTQFHEYFCLCACYPNVGVPRGLDDETRQALMIYGAAYAPRWLTVLDEHMLGERPFVCGETISLADYLGAAFVTLGEIADFDMKPYRNIRRWLARMQFRPNWVETYAGFKDMVAMLRGPGELFAPRPS